MVEPRTLLTGLAFGESPRWHDGRLWLADWGTQEIIAAGLDGSRDVIATVPGRLPLSIDWLPDGRLLVVSGADRQLLAAPPGGELALFADLGDLATAWNEIVVDGHGHVFVNGTGFDLMAGEEYRPGVIALAGLDGTVRELAGDIAFGNGMVVTPDGQTLIVAESYGRRLTAFDIAADGSLSGRRVWADLGEGTPDGICLDAEGAVWYADVPHQCCVRVAAGGAVLDRVELDRGAFACMLGGPRGRTLFIVATEWHGTGAMAEGQRSGVLLAMDAPAPAAGWPRS